MKMPGIGPPLASAIVACVPDPSTLGGVGKERLGSITKAGNPYLRELLVVGAMAVLRRANRISTMSSRLMRPDIARLLAARWPSLPPAEVNAMVRTLEPGETDTLDDMRAAIVRRHEVAVACPVSTAIFLNMCARTAEEQQLPGVPESAA